jgi:hypothetical protein
MGVSNVLRNAYFNWDTAGTAINLSTYIDSVTVNFSVDELEATTMGDTTRNMVGGLQTWEITLNFKHDSASVLDARLFTDLGSAKAFELRPSSGSVSTSNPKLTATGAYFAFNPVPNGAVGELSTTSITVKPSGASPNLTRATS